MDQYTRPLYLFVILSLKGIEVWINEYCIIVKRLHPNKIWNPALISPNLYLSFVFALFPLIWSCGLLPSATIFIQYVFEQVREKSITWTNSLTNVLKLAYYLLGSGPMMSFQIAVLDSLATLFFSIIAAILSFNGYSRFGLLFLVPVSCLLSSRLWIIGFNRLSQNQPLKPDVLSLVYLAFRTSICLVIAIVIGLTSPGMIPSDTHLATPAIQYLLSAVIIFHLILQEIQKSFSLHNEKLKSVTMLQQVHHVSGLAYRVNSNFLPYILLIWICLATLWPPSNGSQSVLMSLYNMDFGYHFFQCIIMVRACRMSWQNARGMGLDALIVIIVDLVLADNAAPSTAYWKHLNLLLRLLLVHVLRITGKRILGKTLMWALSLKHFLLNRKQRINGWGWYLPIILIISPTTIFISSILDAPAMPILGLPLLWMGFPRPKRMWPVIGNIFPAIYSATNWLGGNREKLPGKWWRTVLFCHGPFSFKKLRRGN